MKVSIVLFLLFSTSIFYSHAQPGANNSTFNIVDDCYYGNGSGAESTIDKTLIQSDGQIIHVGNFDFYNGAYSPKIVRTNPDGGMDATFDVGDGFNTSVLCGALQTDDKILVGGSFSLYDGTSVNNIARLNSDATLDPSFDPGIGFNANVLTLSVQTDGKIIVGGAFWLFQGISMSYIGRLNADGSKDLSFNYGTGFNAAVRSTAIQPDGKIIVLGDFTSYNGTPVSDVARLNADGTLDLTFNSGTGINGSGFCLSIQPDNKIVVGGAFSSYNGNSVNDIFRINSDGSFDLSFNIGTGFDGIVSCTTIQPDGKILVSGSFISYNGTPRNRIARLNTDGTMDVSLNPGTGFNSGVSSHTLQSDGKILVGGDFTFFNGTSRIGIARLNQDGTLDYSYNLGSGFNLAVTSSAIQPDGKILLAGDFTLFNGVVRNYFARLHSDGSLDTTFNDSVGFNNIVTAIALQPDGKIILGGYFLTYNGSPCYRLTRLNSDGTLDLTFNLGTGFNDYVDAILIQPDGNILVGGNFTSFNGTPRNRIVRLDPNGALDPLFTIGTGFNNAVRALSIQSDGKIIVGGNFTNYNGTTRGRVARLNTDGTLDLTFNPAGGFSSTVYSLAIQTDDKIVAGGNFSTYAGTSVENIARINTDGTLDLTFATGTGFGNIVQALAIQPDGKIVAGGFFSMFNGTSRNGIARINTDGSLDLPFNPGTGFSNSVYTLAIQPDGKIIAGGDYDGYNGICRHKIARLYINNCSTSSTIFPVACDSFIANGQTYYASGTYVQQIPNFSGCDSTITIQLTINSGLNSTVNQSFATLTAVQTGAIYQWLNCDDGYAEIIGANSAIFAPDTIGNFAVEISFSGCIDTSICTNIVHQDFYDDPTYTSLTGEVFAFPVTTIDSCDASALAFAFGGVAPYSYDWFTQQNNEDVDLIDSLCDGIHVLKIFDNLGDSAFVDYYITDTANFYSWYDTLFTGFVDTIYIAAPNCLLDFSLPLDSGSISQLYYISADTIPLQDLYFIEITYYQAGNTYLHQDTISMGIDGWYLIDFSVYCPIKSFIKIKTMLFDFNYPTILGVETNGQTQFIIYPNPTNGNFILDGLLENSRIEVVNILGEIILSESVFAAKMNLDISNFANGIYMVRVFNEDSSITKLLVKE